MPSDPKSLFSVNGEYNYSVIFIEHGIGEEKYESVILKVVIMASMMLVGRMYCDDLRGSFLCIIYLYLL